MRTESTNIKPGDTQHCFSLIGSGGSEVLHTPGRQPIPAHHGFNKCSQVREQCGFYLKKNSWWKWLGFLQEGKGNKKQIFFQLFPSYWTPSLLHRIQGQSSESQSNLNKCMCLTDLQLFHIKVNVDIALSMRSNNGCLDKVYLTYFLKPHEDHPWWFLVNSLICETLQNWSILRYVGKQMWNLVIHLLKGSKR